MPCPPLSYSTLSALSTTYAPTKPIYVLNLWKYRDNASYLPEHANIAGEPCTGREALQRYITAFRPLIPSGAAIHFKSLPVAVISGAEGEEWDFVAINKYPTLESFMKIVESKEYREGCAGHRMAGLEECKLVVLDQLE
ncbi:hypothetical protein B0J11DRAFT_313842 [Dendryphion nanum]|uniref:DUF1330 domain-containing protein n=1 Tax=Dendryphion nanum TaxID=256645 RepID=A0A9P9INP1_9PLEO|nr:hypothetical protein B0J11DRAFT_313842 [Dendryphion nanum]